MPVIRERVQQARGSSTHWSRSGRHGSSRDRTDFDPAVAVRTRSQRSIRSPRVPTRHRRSVLDADLASAIDRIDHDHLLSPSSARSQPGN